MGLLALSAMREALATFDERDRPAANRIVLYIRPPWDVPRDAWTELARSLAPLAIGAGLEKVVLRVRFPDGRDRVLDVEGLGEGVTVRERPPGQEPIRSLTPYRQKLLRANRFGAPYPYEIVRMLTPPAEAVARFPAGQFVEHDLDEQGTLVPVSRPYGMNTANIVVGLLRNDTEKVPEGMTRVALFGDPTRGLGNLAEPECRRIIAALDLAERMGVPVEWFALSSGAKIAMDSGTENMDWIGAVLRRLIEFTQRGGEVNIVVTGVNVGAQPYWNAEATMLMHTRGILVMTPASAMVLTGKQALDFSGGVSAEDNFGIGGFDRIMGPNGQGQYWAPTLADACDILLRHYEHTYVVPGERWPRRRATTDPVDRDVRSAPHTADRGQRHGNRRRDLLGHPQRRAQEAVRHALGDAGRGRHRLGAAGALGPMARRRDRDRVGCAHRRHPGVSARDRIAHGAPARIRAGRRPHLMVLRHAVPAVVAQAGTRHQRRQRQPAARRAGEPVRVRRLAGVDAPLAIGVRRRDRPRGDQLPRPDRLRGGLPLPRWCVRGVLQEAQRAAGDRRRRGLIRVGDRRCAGGCHRVRPGRRRPHGAGSSRARGGRAGARRDGI